MQYSISSGIIAASMLLTSSVSAIPAEKRGITLNLSGQTYTSSSGVVFYKDIDFQAQYGHEPSCCQAAGNQPTQCWAGTGVNAGHTWEACFNPYNSDNPKDGTATTTFTSGDMSAADCAVNGLIGKGGCSTIKGSGCDNGYVSGGGRLQNVAVIEQQENGFSNEDSLAIQGGIGAMSGMNMATNKFFSIPEHIESRPMICRYENNLVYGCAGLSYIGMDGC